MKSLHDGFNLPSSWGVMLLSPSEGAGLESLGTAADTAAWVLVGLLFFCLGGFTLAAFILKRREQLRSQAALLERRARNQKNNASRPKREGPREKPQPQRDREPWEREPDWWKGS